ncbi:phage terminase large subunit [Siccirubricoccus sp. KC 17139]|uniref:Phage terminase large subunit n=1 Tax=Siccirubricoccus soli TaxID=2899147 RepID=A0ABT1DBZ6_9PROT|nr:phage terminase large subunit [Siccirubricoccus soli]MCO6419102.1 phage terminase large subunit [Siccirubricoccus soli]MCP2685237.1 phage terminase large subunit [Siccirubricoccus soli]
MTQATQPDFLEFVWIWNHVQNQDTPLPHRRIARWLQARQEAGDRRLLLMAFRGCGKSTLVGLYCAWRLLLAPETRILVLAADQPLAVKMVAQVRRILERHPLCRPLLPEGPENWAMDRFTVARDAVLRDPSMLAQGLGGNITGARADLIICDDVEVAGNCDTPAKREELRARLSEIEFVIVPGGTVLFIGTPHCAETLYLHPLQGEAFLAGYRRFTLPLLDAAGNSAWPERFDAAAIEALRSRVGPHRFARQMLLQAVAEAALRLDPALLIRYAEEPEYREASGRAQLLLLGRRLVSGGGFWDPAFGRPPARGVGGDGSVLAATYADGEGNHFLHRIQWLTHDPDAATDPATQQCRAVASLARELLLPVVRVETNGLGRFLPALLRRELARAGAPCTVIEHTSRKAKAERILSALEPALAARRLHAHDAVFRTPFPAEMAAWRPDATGNRDDALDALAGCLLAEPVRLPAVVPAARGQGWHGG